MPLADADGAPSPGAGRAFPPIADYGFLSDCHTGALVAPDGAVEWLCLPRFDSPSVFGAILDRGAGAFRLGPPELRAPVARHYVAGTNVLETTWMCDEGWVVVRDALTYALGSDRDDPYAAGAEGMLVRVAQCVYGHVQIEVVCSPAPGYATERAEWMPAVAPDAQFEAPRCRPPLRIASDLELQAAGGVVRGVISLEEGESCFCALGWSEDTQLPADVTEAHERLDDTEHFWRRWLAGGRFPDHPWRHALQRSALVLKGLMYAPAGSMVAAPTTSLPETPAGERNWDYRYTWIRDATFALWAMHTLGYEDEAREFIGFVAKIFAHHQGPDPQIMFGIEGETDLEERTLDHLSGYRGARPVRIGNGAYNQRQNDVYGALLDSIYVHSKVPGGLPDHLWPVVRDQVEGARRVWREPDQGIWEARGKPRHYVSSKLMCWVALDRGARLAEQWGREEEAAEWRAEAGEIRDDILTRGVSERGVFRQHYETDALDASTLLIPLVRFLPPDDERVRATVLAIADELSENGLVLRYRPEETDDGLGGTREGTFTICSFWLVSALSEIGESRRAAETCAHLLSRASPLGLYAEELDPVTGDHLGNFPQAFTHLALVNAVQHVIADQMAEREAGAPTAVFSEIRALTGA